MDEAVAPALGVEEGLLDLLGTELAVLKTGLIGADALDHQGFVLFAEALGSHGAVGHPVDDEATPDHGEETVGHEDDLPGGEGAALGDEGEAVGEETTDDLLAMGS